MRHEIQLERIQVIGRISTESLQSSDQGEGGIGVGSREIMHPYTGYTVDGRQRIQGCERDRDSGPYDCIARIRKTDDAPMPKRESGVLNVALLGGSVAVGTVHGAPRKYYQRRLSALPEYQGRKVNLHMMAAGGYRQPQPLMMLNYYYTLGAEYDLIISLDGFNEVAIGSNEYKWKKTHPSFPRSWGSRVAATVDSAVVVLQAKKLGIQESHLKRAKLFSNPLGRNSPLSNLLWRILHSKYLVEESKLNLQIENVTSDENTPREFQYEKLGPNYNFNGWDALLEDTAKIWARSNHLVYGVAQAHGAAFFHFVQPNQYIDGAKPHMTQQEKAIAFVKPGEGGYGQWYRQGFKFVKEQQMWMQSKGVNSTDLTFLYKDETGPIYIDNCCHVNSRGSEMIVDAIVNTIHAWNLANPKPNSNHSLASEPGAEYNNE